ncbi:non-specific lipid transfer protein GPI-anchored 2 [Beta vulgaris subsp. vulgaris]|uniref:non-specific lipid transfer protein GPI-anchored 2 n=1 Tax=Beta vulgaris subsp. vulgaris TaxID=3555 RepID=UPI0020374BD3|nr:non-specific lipid transfer protein GPI-anchored 2 [Beta vulgaris subsp. vulgaris]
MAISSKTTMWVVLIFGLISIGSLNVNAQSPAPAPGPGTDMASDCMTLIYNMSDCLTYAEKGSKLTKPDKNCCPELAGMLDANPLCLCQLLGKSKDFPVDLDLKKALKLPSACSLQTPDVSLCSAVGIPVGAPAGAPTSSEGPSSSSSAGMSPEAAEAAGGRNGASSAHFSVAYLIAGFTMAFTLLKL